MTRERRRWFLGVVGVCAGILLISGIVYGKSKSLKSLESLMKQAAKHVQQCAQYGKEGKYAQSEAECTQAIIMLKKALDSKNEVRLKNPYKFDANFSSCAQDAHFVRGFSLYLQGDLSCAWSDFFTAWKWGESYIANPHNTEEAEQLYLKILNEIKRTGRRGRKDCPERLYVRDLSLYHRIHD